MRLRQTERPANRIRRKTSESDCPSVSATDDMLLTTKVMTAYEATLAPFAIKCSYHSSTTTFAKYRGSDIKLMNSSPTAVRATTTWTAIFVKLLKLSTTTTFALDNRIGFFWPPVIARRSMICSVMGVGLIDFQVLRSIIASISIDVMHDLPCFQRPTKHCFCHKAMFIDVTCLICQWMILCLDEHISMFGQIPAIFHITTPFCCAYYTTHSSKDPDQRESSYAHSPCISTKNKSQPNRFICVF